jgi:ankyrin repeat protein
MNRAPALCICIIVSVTACSKKPDTTAKLVPAVSQGNISDVAALLSSGADANAREDTAPHRSLLIIAAEEDYGDIASLLVAHGADVNAKSEDGSTALMNAAAEGNAEIVSLLISKGADLNTADNSGQTPLIKAAGEGQARAVEILVAHGADINHNDKSGITAIMKALINGHGDVATTLMQKGARFTDGERKKVQDMIRSETRTDEIIDTENK